VECSAPVPASLSGAVSVCESLMIKLRSPWYAIVLFVPGIVYMRCEFGVLREELSPGLMGVVREMGSRIAK
jgi:hypothetical protein